MYCLTEWYILLIGELQAFLGILLNHNGQFEIVPFAVLLAICLNPFYFLYAYLTDKILAVIQKVVTIPDLKIARSTFAINIQFAPAGRHVDARAEMSCLNLTEWHDVATADTLAASIGTRITKPDIELKHLVEFINMLLLIFDWLLNLNLRNLELRFL